MGHFFHTFTPEAGDRFVAELTTGSHNRMEFVDRVRNETHDMLARFQDMLTQRQEENRERADENCERVSNVRLMLGMFRHELHDMAGELKTAQTAFRKGLGHHTGSASPRTTTAPARAKASGARAKTTRRKSRRGDRTQ